MQGRAARFARLVYAPVIDAAHKAIEQTDKAVRELLKDDPQYNAMLRIKGVGQQTAAVLRWILSKGEFASSDALVACCGLDVRIRQSGRYRGYSKLTKRGDHLARRFLYNGANALRCNKAWRAKMLTYEQRGLSKIQTNVIFARKLLRIAYAVAAQGAVYDENVALGLDSKP